MPLNFCRQPDQIVINRWFKKSKTKLYPWKSPQDRKCISIYYMFAKQRFRNSIGQMNTFPGADIDSNYNSVAAEVQTWLKPIKKAGKRQPKWNLE